MLHSKFALMGVVMRYLFFFFNDTATTEIYTLSLHDALPISSKESIPNVRSRHLFCQSTDGPEKILMSRSGGEAKRSEEHTSELQSRLHLVCRLLLEKKKQIHNNTTHDLPALQPRAPVRLPLN